VSAYILLIFYNVYHNIVFVVHHIAKYNQQSITLTLQQISNKYMELTYILLFTLCTNINITITWKYTDKEASTSERKIKLLPENPNTLNKIKKSTLTLYAWIYVAESWLNSPVNLLLDLLKLKCYCKRKCILYSITCSLAGWWKYF
jgi:hypothetical protein